jgi:hypothetical protein
VSFIGTFYFSGFATFRAVPDAQIRPVRFWFVVSVNKSKDKVSNDFNFPKMHAY